MASDSSSPDFAPLVSLSGKVTPRPASWRGWKTRPWSLRLFGAATSPGWTPPHFSAWISSLQGSPASRGPALANAKARKTPAGSGRTSPPSFARLDPDSSFWKTSRASLLGDSDTFLQTWPASGSMRNGACYRRPTWAPRISASGSSSWPTATVMDSASSGSKPGSGHVTLTDRAVRQWPTATATPYGNNQSASPGAAVRPSLNTMARTGSWPTPVAHGTERSAEANIVHRAQTGRKGYNELNVVAKLWQTPSVADTTGGHATRGGERSGELLLNGQAANWPTPRSRDEKGKGYEDGLPNVAQSWPTPTAAAGQRGSDPTRDRGPGPSLDGMAASFPSGQPDPTTPTGGDGSLNSGPTSRPRCLNPRFVGWLMNFPPGWTDVSRPIDSTSFAAWAMQSRQHVLRLLGSSLLGERG